MTDDTQKKNWFDRLGDLIFRWIIGVVKFAAAFVALIAGVAVVLYLGVFYISPSNFYDIHDHSSISRWLARCDTLDEELAVDILCWRSDECKMTRKEFATYQKRSAKYELHCEVNDE